MIIDAFTGPSDSIVPCQATKLSDLKKADQELFAKKFTQYDLGATEYEQHLALILILHRW